jgi:hypothetical protein
LVRHHSLSSDGEEIVTDLQENTKNPSKCRERCGKSGSRPWMSKMVLQGILSALDATGN